MTDLMNVLERHPHENQDTIYALHDLLSNSLETLDELLYRLENMSDEFTLNDYEDITMSRNIISDEEMNHEEDVIDTITFMSMETNSMTQSEEQHFSYVLFDEETIDGDMSSRITLSVNLPYPLITNINNMSTIINHNNYNSDENDGIENVHDDIMCAICLDKFESEEKWIEKYKHRDRRRMLCGHKYCSNCIEKWLEISMKCPYCMSDLNGLSTNKIKN